jgi:hypothetical protein
MQQHYIAGVVVDLDNTPLEGASVKIYRCLPDWRRMEQIGYGKTEANGLYVAAFDAGSNVIVRYDHFPGAMDNCHPTLLSRLSGASNQTVNVVMYRIGLGYAQDDVLEILSAYERVYLLDVSRPVPVAEINKTYRSGLGMLKYVDDITKQRYEQVTALYDHRA